MRRQFPAAPVALLFLVLSICSCSMFGSKDLTLAQIADASSLIVGNAALAKSASTKVLLKWTDTGQLQTVEMIDESGSRSAAVPAGIYAVGDYVVLVFSADEFAHTTYLVRKSDGAAFSLNGTPQSTPNGKRVYVDGQDRVYYLSAGRVWRVDTSSLIEESVTPSVDDVDCFAVDSDGNVLYKYYQWYPTTIAGVRVARASGGLVNFPYFLRFFFVAPDGKLYCQDNSESNKLIIKRVVVSPAGSLSLETYGQSTSYGFVYCDYQHEWLYLEDRILAFCDNSYELWNASGVPRYLPGYNRKFIAGTDSYYFVATKNAGLVRVNPSNDDALTLFDGDYDIYAMGALPNDSLLFHGLSLESSTLVTATVDSSGAILIQTEIGDSTIFSIVRIN